MQVSYRNFDFVIESDNPDVGCYLYVYKDGKCIRDYLQNDKETCIIIANEDYGVPKEHWDQSGHDKLADNNISQHNTGSYRSEPDVLDD